MHNFHDSQTGTMSSDRPFDAGNMEAPSTSGATRFKRGWDDSNDDGEPVQPLDLSQATKKYQKSTHAEAFPENKKSDQLWVKYYGLEDWKTQIKTGHPGVMFNEPKGFKREIAFWADLELITSYGKCVMLS